jgi:hypothetical protein
MDLEVLKSWEEQDMEDVVKVLRDKKIVLEKQLEAISKALGVLDGNSGVKPRRGRKGKPMSEATKAKLRASAKKRWAKVKKAA